MDIIRLKTLLKSIVLSFRFSNWAFETIETVMNQRMQKNHEAIAIGTDVFTARAIKNWTCFELWKRLCMIWLPFHTQTVCFFYSKTFLSDSHPNVFTAFFNLSKPNCPLERNNTSEVFTELLEYDWNGICENSPCETEFSFSFVECLIPGETYNAENDLQENEKRFSGYFETDKFCQWFSTIWTILKTSVQDRKGCHFT